MARTLAYLVPGLAHFRRKEWVLGIPLGVCATVSVGVTLMLARHEEGRLVPLGLSLCLFTWLVNAAILSAEAGRPKPGEIDPVLREGMACLLHQDRFRAEDLFRKVVQTDPNDREGWLYLGLIHREQGNLRDAKRALRRCRRLDADGTWAPELDKLLGELP